MRRRTSPRGRVRRVTAHEGVTAREEAAHDRRRCGEGRTERAVRPTGGEGEALRDARVLVDGRPLCHRERRTEDAALPVVHVHGFALSGSYLLPTARLLARRFTTYVADLPGFGRSIPGPGRPGLPDPADSLAGFADTVGAPVPTAVGNSVGCPCARWWRTWTSSPRSPSCPVSRRRSTSATRGSRRRWLRTSSTTSCRRAERIHPPLRRPDGAPRSGGRQLTPRA
ncbi:alpha/beta fold hydrolase [Thalassiella azotivora]